MRRGSGKIRAFTLFELMAVVVLILIMLGMTVLTFANSRPSIKVRRDASQMVAFLRNMWDLSKATGTDLVLEPDFESGKLAYLNPRGGQRYEAKLAAESRVIGIKLNDRLYSRASLERDIDGETGLAEGIHVGEGRGLAYISVLFGIPDEDSSDLSTYKFLTQCSLNLITGRGEVLDLTAEEFQALVNTAEQAAAEGT